jgi:hypothetical protein
MGYLIVKTLRRERERTEVDPYLAASQLVR